jgi:hypothetical protein
MFAVLAALSGLMVVGTVRAAGPAIVVAPVPIATGGQVTVSGTGFCGSSGCSGVTVTLSSLSFGRQRVAASGVAGSTDARRVGFSPALGTARAGRRGSRVGLRDDRAGRVSPPARWH